MTRASAPASRLSSASFISWSPTRSPRTAERGSASASAAVPRAPSSTACRTEVEARLVGRRNRACGRRWRGGERVVVKNTHNGDMTLRLFPRRAIVEATYCPSLVTVSLGVKYIYESSSVFDLEVEQPDRRARQRGGKRERADLAEVGARDVKRRDRGARQRGRERDDARIGERGARQVEARQRRAREREREHARVDVGEPVLVPYRPATRRPSALHFILRSRKKSRTFGNKKDERKGRRSAALALTSARARAAAARAA